MQGEKGSRVCGQEVGESENNKEKRRNWHLAPTADKRKARGANTCSSAARAMDGPR
ncbi:hypothetical protein F385_3340 [Pantoea agglomerans 299R]|nr:hypothetical protein F385_3340 [Pantoea agglomerans 299R]